VTRGFEFRIDYDRAIAEDDRVITWAEFRRRPACLSSIGRS
jgi:hypothetical protein